VVARSLSLNDNDEITGLSRVFRQNRNILRATTGRPYEQIRKSNCSINRNLKCYPIFGLVAQPGERTVRIRKVEGSIRGFKGEPRPGKYVEIVEDLSFRELCQVLEDASLEVWDEYYCQGQALYKCCIYPYKEGQLWDQVEITVHFEEKKIEYYIED